MAPVCLLPNFSIIPGRSSIVTFIGALPYIIGVAGGSWLYLVLQCGLMVESSGLAMKRASKTIAIGGFGGLDTLGIELRASHIVDA